MAVTGVFQGQCGRDWCVSWSVWPGLVCFRVSVAWTGVFQGQCDQDWCVSGSVWPGLLLGLLQSVLQCRQQLAKPRKELYVAFTLPASFFRLRRARRHSKLQLHSYCTKLLHNMYMSIVFYTIPTHHFIG